MAAGGFLGAGDLYIARYVNGAFENYKGPFQCEKFEIKPNSELREKVSKGRSTYGQVIESVPVPQPADLTVDLGEVNREALALAFFGTTAVLAQSAGTMTDESVTVQHDEWVPLTNAALNASGISVRSASGGGGTLFVEGEDYLLNRQQGWIKALSTGAMTDDTAAYVSGGYAAISGTEIKGMTQTQVRAKFKLDGINFVDQRPVIVTVHEGIVAADAAFDFLSDDFATLSLPGRMKTPTGFTEPFTVHLRDA